MLILFDFSSNIILPSRRPTNLSEYFLAKSTWWRLHKIVVPKSSLIFFNKDFGTTILCNLHQVDLAKKYSDRLVGLLDGKIIFDEKSENINKTNLEKIYV